MKKSLSILLALLLIVSVFTSCGTTKPVADTVKYAETVEVTAEIGGAYPVNGEVDFHTDIQSAYISGEYKKLPDGIEGTAENSRPEPVEFKWVYNGKKAENAVYTLTLSENPDMSDAVSYEVIGEESLPVYNLKIAQDYYWTVTADGKVSEICHFKTTSAAPRNMYVDGITNVRDIGGRVTESGVSVRQGLIYRCARLNNNQENGGNVIITADGKKTMLEDMKIKTEIDVREVDNDENGGITSSPLGDGVQYISLPMDWSGKVFKDNKEQIIKLFEVLADEDNYPMIIHCSIGTDRTGMISYLINALMGVSQEELFKDYMYSNFADIGGERKISNIKSTDYYKAVKKADGDTLSEQAYNCLTDFGVPKENLDSLIKILSEEK